MTMDEFPNIEADLKSPLAKYIMFAANDSVYSGSQLNTPYVLKVKAATSKKENPPYVFESKGSCNQIIQP